MAIYVWIATALLSIHAANSYILLTANLDDVQNIARQLAASPIADQVSKIWRRASGQFTQYLNKIDRSEQQFRNFEASQQQFRNFDARDQRRNEGRAQKDQEMKISDSIADDLDEQRSRRNDQSDDFVELGKNASIYLKSLRRMFENPPPA